MKIGNWQETIEAEKAFWARWLDIFYQNEGDKRAGRVQWEFKADIIAESLRCLGAYPTDESRVLEIGGGLIDTMRWLDKGKLYAIDPLWDFFEAHRPRLGVRWQPLRHDVVFITERAEDLPLDSGPFDIALILNALDHCENPTEVMRRISATMKDRGLLYESTTAWAYGKVDVRTLGQTHPNVFHADELHRMIASFGFGLLEDPFCGKDINEPWTAEWTEASWPTYLRVWRRP